MAWRLVSAAVLGLCLSGCASGGLSGNVFRQGEVAFRVGPIPDGWNQLDQAVEGDLASFAFRDSAGGVTIGAAGRCHKDGDDVPLRALTRHLYLGFTNRHIDHEEDLQLDGRAALRTEMRASLDGVEKSLVFVVLKKNGCVYDFWRIADAPSDTSDFDTFVAGFRVVE
jgi:hypothetical protein